MLHVQWLAPPEIDERLLRLRAPAVFTAHDLLPRRTAAKREPLAAALRRVSSASSCTASAAATRSPSSASSPTPPRDPASRSFASDPPRNDDGHTLLCVGVIRPVQGPRRRDRGDETRGRRSAPRRRRPGRAARRLPRAGRRPGRVAARLPARGEVDRALGEATVALFPYRPEIDQSAALLRALGAGVPAVAYDVGGLGEPVRRFGAGRVVPAGDVDALDRGRARAARRPRRARSRRARAPSARAQELTWDAAAAGAPRPLPGAPVIRAPLRRRHRPAARPLRARAGRADRRTATRPSCEYNRADRDEAEELYGDYVDLVEAGTEVLADLRDTYASTLDEEAAEEYEARVQPRRRQAPTALRARDRGHLAGD